MLAINYTINAPQQQMQTLTRFPCHQQRWRQHQQTGVNMRYIDRIQEIALKTLPNAQTLIGAHRDHVARSARQRNDSTVMRLNAVHTSTGQQFPNAQQSVLGTRTARVRLIVIDEEAGNWTAMAVQCVEQLTSVQREYLREYRILQSNIEEKEKHE